MVPAPFGEVEEALFYVKHQALVQAAPIQKADSRLAYLKQHDALQSCFIGKLAMKRRVNALWSIRRVRHLLRRIHQPKLERLAKEVCRRSLHQSTRVHDWAKNVGYKHANSLKPEGLRERSSRSRTRQTDMTGTQSRMQHQSLRREGLRASLHPTSSCSGLENHEFRSHRGREAYTRRILLTVFVDE